MVISLTRMFKSVTRDDTFDARKVLNAHEVILAAKQAKYTGVQISKICDVTEPMISHWGNKNSPTCPSLLQIKPLVQKLGEGRVELELEPLSPAAREYRKGTATIIASILLSCLFILIWFLTIKPCQEEWDQCKQLPWYKMGAYEQLKVKAMLDELRQYKVQKEGLD